jgi:hypothetical protein
MFIYVIINVKFSLFMNELYLIVCKYHTVFIHASFDGHMYCFHFFGFGDTPEIIGYVQMAALHINSI